MTLNIVETQTSFEVGKKPRKTTTTTALTNGVYSTHISSIGLTFRDNSKDLCEPFTVETNRPIALPIPGRGFIVTDKVIFRAPGDKFEFIIKQSKPDSLPGNYTQLVCRAVRTS